MDQAELDADLRSACHALSEGAPAGYFDSLSARIETRLEAAEMQGREMSEQKRDKPYTAGTAPVTTPREDIEDQEEHSGLHDIQALAESTKKRISRRQTTQSEVDESLLASASASSMRAVALPSAGKEVSPLPRSPRGTGQQVTVTANDSVAMAVTPSVSTRPAKKSSTWMYAAGALAVVAAGAIFYLKQSGGDKAPTKSNGSEMVAANTPAAGSAPGAVPGVTVEGLAAADTTQPSGVPSAALIDDSNSDDNASPPSDTVAATGAGAAVAVADAKPSRSGSDAAADKASSKRAGDDAPAAKPSETKAPPADKASAKDPKAEASTVGLKAAPAGDKSLDDLLSAAAGGPLDSGKPKQAVADDEPSKKSLDRSDLQKAMGGIKGKIRGCFDTHQERGTVTVKFVVTPDGAVTGAKATGTFAGTPSGDCVVAAVSGAKLPAFSGAQMSFSYPFLLSD